MESCSVISKTCGGRRCIAGWDSLKRCPEDEAVKMKPKSQGQPQDIGDASITEESCVYGVHVDSPQARAAGGRDEQSGS